MTVQAWIILTGSEKTDAEALNDGAAAVEARAIDNTMANSLGEGTLVGKFVLPARLLNDASYSRWSYLSALPIRTMDSEVLFLPVVVEL